jgi:hypothetical protein
VRSCGAVLAAYAQMLRCAQDERLAGRLFGVRRRGFSRSGFVLRQDLRRIEQTLDAFRKALETVGFWQDIINADRGHEGFVAQDFIVHRQQDDPHRWHPCP